MINKYLIWLISVYQKKHFKPKFYRRCSFIPTCSEFAIQQLNQKNFFLAIPEIVNRLLSCSKISKTQNLTQLDSFVKP